MTAGSGDDRAARGDDAPWTGRVLEGRYHVQRILGAGGMGTVYLADDEKVDRPVVVKVPHARFLAEGESRERFVREIRKLIRFEHSHIVKVIDVGTAEDVPFAVLQWLAGGSLKDHVASRGGRLSPMEVARWLPRIADALDYLHAQGIVHRDVKPGNLLLDLHGDVYLADIGIAKAVRGDESALTRTGGAPGSYDYAAPEQFENENLTGAADQCALATVVYETLSGRRPYVAATTEALIAKKVSRDPEPLGPLAPNVPAACAAAVMRALCRDPAARFESCTAFSEAFVAALSVPVPAATPAAEPAEVRPRAARPEGARHEAPASPAREARPALPRQAPTPPVDRDPIPRVAGAFERPAGREPRRFSALADRREDADPDARPGGVKVVLATLICLATTFLMRIVVAGAIDRAALTEELSIAARVQDLSGTVAGVSREAVNDAIDAGMRLSAIFASVASLLIVGIAKRFRAAHLVTVLFMGLLVIGDIGILAGNDLHRVFVFSKTWMRVDLGLAGVTLLALLAGPTRRFFWRRKGTAAPGPRVPSRAGRARR